MDAAQKLSVLALALGATLLSACATDEGPRDERLRGDVRWMTREERAGRRAGTPGELETAEWIAGRLAWLGLDPGGEEGYYQRFPVPLAARDGGGSYLVTWEGGGAGSEGDRRIERGTPLWFSGGGRVEGPVVFRGYGIQDPARGWTDYGGESAPQLPLNAIVLVLDGAPPALEDSPEAPLPTALEKALEARRRGAVGMLVVRREGSPSEDARAIPAEFEPSLAAEAGLPALSVDEQTAARLVPELRERAALLEGRRRHADPAQEVFAKIGVSADVHRDGGTAANVLGLVRGGPGPVVLIAAHYDALGAGGPGTLDPGELGQLHAGADDNASGVAVALEVARALARRETPPAGDVLFAFFSAEELGRLGSEAWCLAPSVPLSRLALCIDVDSVGRAGTGRLTVLGAGTSPAFRGWMAEVAERASLKLQVSYSTRGLGGGDHQTFYEREIPTLVLTSGPAPEHHRAGDRPELFEAEGAAKVATLVLELLQRAQDRDELDFTYPPAPPVIGESGYPVRFGAVRALDHVGAGLRLSSVTSGSPAERAGLSAGDILLEAGGVQIEAMQDFLEFLQMHKPTDVVRVRFERDGVELETLLTLERRPGAEEEVAEEVAPPAFDLRPEGVPDAVIERDLELAP